MSASKDEKDYLWEHFKFNADQRLKAFNFFVVLAVFADGGVFAALERASPRPGLIFIMGLFVVLLALVFALIDHRSQHLTFLARDGLSAYEEQFPERSRLFARDAQRQSKWVRYTHAFRALYVAELLFGLGVIGWAIRQPWLPL